jgi:hypothetical protein
VYTVFSPYSPSYTRKTFLDAKKEVITKI